MLSITHSEAVEREVSDTVKKVSSSKVEDSSVGMPGRSLVEPQNPLPPGPGQC